MKTRDYMQLYTTLTDEHDALDSVDRSTILNGAKNMLERYNRMFDEAHLKLHVKTTEDGKSLVHVRAHLHTDNGSHNTETHGYDPHAAVDECLENLRQQLAKRYDKMLDRGRSQGSIGE